MKKNIEIGTIIRTIVLTIALLNQFLEMAGFCPLPFEYEKIYEILTTIFTAVASLIAWWKNNSFTQSALEADEWKKNNKEK